MKKQYNVAQAKEVEGRDKPIWIKLGRAFANEKGIRVKLHALPLPDGKGEVWFTLFEQDDNNNDGANQFTGGN